jgi:hypothetical protein
MECYSALKRNEVLPHTAVWVNLKNKPHKSRQMTKDTRNLHLQGISRIDQSTETEHSLVAARSWKKEQEATA